MLGDEEDEGLPAYEELKGPEVQVPQEKESGIHYIQALDTLQGIALSYGVPVRFFTFLLFR